MRELEREETLITRVIDREDDLTVWRELEHLAATDPGLWCRLAGGLRDDAWLRTRVAPAFAIAERVGLPPRSRAGSGPLWFTWTGWLAAAVFAGFALTSARPNGVTTPRVPAGELRLAGTEIDSIVLDARPAASGEGYDVVLLRRAVERTHVEDLYRLAWDEQGVPRAVPAELPAPPPIREDF